MAKYHYSQGRLFGNKRRSHQYKNKGGKSVFSRALGMMVGLLLGLYVFNSVFTPVAAGMCTSGSTLKGTSSLLEWNGTASTGHQCVWTNSTNGGTVYIDDYNRSDSNYGTQFDLAVNFETTLLPVIGILGAFEIIYWALKKSGMM